MARNNLAEEPQRKKKYRVTGEIYLLAENRYPMIGDVIELTDDQAQVLNGLVEPAGQTVKPEENKEQ